MLQKLQDFSAKYHDNYSLTDYHCKMNRFAYLLLKYTYIPILSAMVITFLLCSVESLLFDMQI